MPHPLTISIVIPVYNDEVALDHCLAAIAAQTHIPQEVIVVDNNSTDHSIAVAQRYPFVTVLREKKQGVVYARNRGFDQARGDIIGRLDADSRIEPHWVATVQQLFTTTSADAISGSIQYYDVACAPALNLADRIIRRHLSNVLGNEVSLQGANMAIRRSAWLRSRSLMCTKRGLHEDFDLAIHLREAGCSNRYTPSLRCSTALRQAAGNWAGFATYMIAGPATYFRHRRVGGIHILYVVLVVLIIYPVLHALQANQDETAGFFSWKKLISGAASSRVNPATFVD